VISLRKLTQGRERLPIPVSSRERLPHSHSPRQHLIAHGGAQAGSVVIYSQNHCTFFGTDSILTMDFAHLQALSARFPMISSKSSRCPWQRAPRGIAGSDGAGLREMIVNLPAHPSNLQANPGRNFVWAGRSAQFVVSAVRCPWQAVMGWS
jgi:hypothetical protein